MATNETTTAPNGAMVKQPPIKLVPGVVRKEQSREEQEKLQADEVIWVKPDELPMVEAFLAGLRAKQTDAVRANKPLQLSNRRPPPLQLIQGGSSGLNQ